jgi:hypothetical protein
MEELKENIRWEIVNIPAELLQMGYVLDDGGGLCSSTGRVKNVSLLHIVETGSGAHTASYPMGTGGSFLEG